MRRVLPLLALSLVLGACGTEPDPRPTPELVMTMPRASHTATPLADGRVLIAGGCTTDGCGGTPDGGRSEFYEPETGRFVGGPVMVHARVGHTATRLPDGRVLFVGGYPDEGRPPLAAIELYDPARGAFVEAGALATGRGSHTATALADGRVLIVGGENGGQLLSTVEIFDPSTGRVRPAAPLPAARAIHAATRLADGRILVVGGKSGPLIVGTAIVYDPVDDRWTPVGPLATPRYKTGLAPTADGGAIVLGGQTADDPDARLADTERYDPATASFVQGPTMTEPRYKISDAVVVLRDGRIVVAGNRGVDVIDGSTVERRATSTVERQFTTATELPDGQVLVTGGYTNQTRVTASAMVVPV